MKKVPKIRSKTFSDIHYSICSLVCKKQVTLVPNKRDFGQFGGGLSRFVATHIASKVQYLPSTFFKDYKSPIKVLKLAHFFQFPVRVANWVVAEKLNYKYLVYIVRNLAATTTMVRSSMPQKEFLFICNLYLLLASPNGALLLSKMASNG